MESGDFLKSNAPPLSAVEDNVAVAAAAPEAEWHSVPLEESLRSETEYCFLLSEGKQATKPSRTVDLSMCGLSKLIGGGADDESNVPASKIDCKYISIKASEDSSGLKEVRVSIHGLEDPKKSSENVVYKTGSKVMNDSEALLGHGDDGCLPLIQQVRAFIKGAKLSCAGLLSGDGKPLSNGWSSLVQRSFSFKSSSSSTSESEESNSPAFNRSASAPTPTCSVCNTGTPDAVKASPLQARDPASRAEALPLAHYRPTDGAIWKEGDAKTVQSTTGSKSPVNCKKPPKPPRYPGRSTSLDSATLAAQRAAKKCRDKASAKRKSRVMSAAASTGLTPLVALALTIGFGLLMVFQGVFVQTTVSYGRNASGAYVNVAANSRPTLLARKIASYENFNPIDYERRTPPVDDQSSLVAESVNFTNRIHKRMTHLQPFRPSSCTRPVRCDCPTRAGVTFVARFFTFYQLEDVGMFLPFFIQLAWFSFFFFSASCEHNVVTYDEMKCVRSSPSVWEDLDVPFVQEQIASFISNILTDAEHFRQ